MKDADSFVDVDNFVLGIKDNKKPIPPLEVNLKKALEYMKKTGKTFKELTPEEKDRLK